MLRRFLFAAAGLAFGLTLQTAAASEPGQAKKSGAGEVCTAEGCGQYGTSVNFYPTPSDAAKQALKEEKLVFVLHVSGNFENPEFT